MVKFNQETFDRFNKKPGQPDTTLVHEKEKDDEGWLTQEKLDEIQKSFDKIKTGTFSPQDMYQFVHLVEDLKNDFVKNDKS